MLRWVGRKVERESLPGGLQEVEEAALLLIVLVQNFQCSFDLYRLFDIRLYRWRQARMDGGGQGDPQHLARVVLDECSQQLLAVGGNGEQIAQKPGLLSRASQGIPGIQIKEVLCEVFCGRVWSRGWSVLSVGESHHGTEHHAQDEKTGEQESRSGTRKSGESRGCGRQLPRRAPGIHKGPPVAADPSLPKSILLPAFLR
jgi:hypothetical protein